MPTWSDAKTNYVNGDVPTNAQLQTLSDDVSVLLSRPYSEYIGPTSPDITTTSVTYVALGSYSISLTTAKTGGILFCYFCGTFQHNTAGAEIRVKLTCTGLSTIGTSNTSIADFILTNAGEPYPVNIILLGVANNTAHTVDIQWNTSAGTARLVSAYRSHLFVQEGIN